MNAGAGAAAVPQAGAAPRSDLTPEQEAEAKLRAKYGGLVPKKKGAGLLQSRKVRRRGEVPEKPLVQPRWPRRLVRLRPSAPGVVRWQHRAAC